MSIDIEHIEINKDKSKQIIEFYRYWANIWNE